MYVTYGNTKNVFEKNTVLKTKTMNNLSQKWADNNIDTGKSLSLIDKLNSDLIKKIVDPPFIEKIANFISEKNMKMPLFKMPNV